MYGAGRLAVRSGRKLSEGEHMVDGDKLAELRKQQGLGLRELAAKAGIDHSVISRLERNLQEDCMSSSAVSIASVLGVTVDEVLQLSQQVINRKIVPELQAINNELARYSPKIQRQAAGILRGYLLTLNDSQGKLI
jgi:transcriptional regulator with XRE-family HTH domain